MNDPDKLIRALCHFHRKGTPKDLEAARYRLERSSSNGYIKSREFWRSTSSNQQNG